MTSDERLLSHEPETSKQDKKKSSKKEKKSSKKIKEVKKEKKTKKDKKIKKEKKTSACNDTTTATNNKHSKRKSLEDSVTSEPCTKRIKTANQSTQDDQRGKNVEKFSFPIQYILAPMVGASELAFRLLCRKYGAQTCYTPMMSSTRFASDPEYRKEEFQTIPEDRPLVCHFSANDPEEFTNAARLVQDRCDAIDLNLGCPQRTAFVGHFGSYLLDPKDRTLICDIVRMASRNISVPIFCKIRLLDTIEDTIVLCQQLRDAGASLIAIHARYRASFERKGPGARDGPAMLDQILKVREALGPDFPLIANGNVITFEDVENNLRYTAADGIMSAEGILDNPALFLPRLGEDEHEKVEIAVPSPLQGDVNSASGSVLQETNQKKKRKLQKKLREIEAIQVKMASGAQLTQEQTDKMLTKDDILSSLAEIQESERLDIDNHDVGKDQPKYTQVTLKELKLASSSKTNLANEYIDLAEKYPTKLRTVIFHTRRILKHELNKYQLMEDCVASKSISDLRQVISKVETYLRDPSKFSFDKEKAQKEKEALERKKREEGKRKAYEARMIRKAKREGKSDLEFYLRQGSQVPTMEEIKELKKLPRDEQLQKWKEHDHSQHCMAFHLDGGGCKRDRACAFLHVDAKGENSFAEVDEVAG